MTKDYRTSELRIPTLRNDDLDPMEFAQTTCFEAGYLVSTNGGWRQVRPVVDAAACTSCLQCYLYCPDGAIRKTHLAKGEGAAVFVDLDFCKGCGICQAVCRFDAISMVPERDAAADAAGEGAGQADAGAGVADATGQAYVAGEGAGVAAADVADEGSSQTASGATGDGAVQVFESATGDGAVQVFESATGEDAGQVATGAVAATATSATTESEAI